MKCLKIFVIFATFFLCNVSFAQSQNNVENLKDKSKKLERAIDNNNEPDQANTYIEIADSYFSQGNFLKSEAFLNKAKTIFEKLKDKENLAIVTRKLAQTQEKQNKMSSAVSNYKKASDVGSSKYSNEINSNDASRLSSNSTTKKEQAVQQNIQANESKKAVAELSQDYENLADIKVKQGKIAEASKSLEDAYELSKDKQPEKAVAINQKNVAILVNEKQFDKAIKTKQKILNEDFVQNNSKEKVNQIQELANIYLKSNNKEKAIKLYKNAYEISIEKNHTLEARESVLKLDSLYKTDKNFEKSINLYENFLSKLPLLIKNDNSLLDAKITAETEDKIAQLEKEKDLKDELIRKKNNFNYGLLASLVLLLGLVGFIFYTLKKLQIKNKKIALQSLRREMNPHFIFNSLNSINQFISENNELEANQYLTKFSKLMRGVMENSTKDFIPFQQELDLLQNYLSLEKTRFADKFSYEIEVDENLNLQNLKIPGMLIQPFLENAIWHGLRYKLEKGFLKLNFEKNNNKLIIRIEDNGIGIEESKKQKTNHQKQREGRGMKNTLERIKLLNNLYKKNISCRVKDKQNGSGVLIILTMQT